MPKKKSETNVADPKKRRFSKELIDELLASASPEAQEGGTAAILKELAGAVVNRALEAELTTQKSFSTSRAASRLLVHRQWLLARATACSRKPSTTTFL